MAGNNLYLFVVRGSIIINNNLNHQAKAKAKAGKWQAQQAYTVRNSERLLPHQ
jgi:hypothetical protein